MGFEHRATILFCVGKDKVEVLRVSHIPLFHMDISSFPQTNPP
jgi:hypothetical protein